MTGVDGAVGAVYKYSNVATISGAQIDAYITITGMTNATLATIDNDAPAGYVPPSGTTAADVFAPEVNTTAAGGHVDFLINFKDPNGNNLTLLNFVNNSIDIDGAGNPGAFQEFVEYGGFDSYTLGSPTDLSVSQGVIDTDRVRFTGTSLYNGLIVNDVGRVQANFDGVTSFQISMGATASTGGARQYGSLFSSIAFTSSTTTIVPTVNELTTNDDTPLLTGTIGAPTLGSDTFKVVVNGTDYTIANGLNINPDGTWSLQINTSLPSAAYDVRAVRTVATTGLELPDQTASELVINNAPTLSDTVLSMTVVEDAAFPSGAVGSPISTFVGGASDTDAGAVKGIAIIGTNETNGTWYYTLDSGTTWTAINAVDGSVSTSNALLLANDPSTRLYFKPTADFNGSAPAALTFRAWDQTRGTEGDKVDPGTVGGSTAYSTATDVIDVTVTPVYDAPVNTVPGAQATGTNTDLVFSALNANQIRVTDGDNTNLTVTLTVTNGTLTLAGTSGLTFSTGDGTADTTMTFIGLPSAINAALDGLIYKPTAGFTGSSTFTILTSDGTTSDSDTVTTTVAAPTGAPRLDLNSASATQQAGDTFVTQSYSNTSTGVIPWAGNWVESDVGGAGATAGDVQIVDPPGGSVDYAIRLTDISNQGGTAASRAAISRAIDLSDYINASLQFTLSTSGNLDNPDTYIVEISTDGGATFTTLASYQNDVTGTQTVSLAGYESANNVIRFRLTGNFDNNEFVYIDNVIVTAQPTGYTNPQRMLRMVQPVAFASTTAITDSNSTNMSKMLLSVGNYVAGDRITIDGTTIDLVNGASGTTTTNGMGYSVTVTGGTANLLLTGTKTISIYQSMIQGARFDPLQTILQQVVIPRVI